MHNERKHAYGHNVISNGRNWNALKLLTALGEEKQGHRLTGINLSFKGEGVLVVLKKDSPKGPQVAFLNAHNLDDALYVTAAAVKSKQLKWKPDKWVTTRSDKNQKAV